MYQNWGPTMGLKSKKWHVDTTPLTLTSLETQSKRQFIPNFKPWASLITILWSTVEIYHFVEMPDNYFDYQHNIPCKSNIWRSILQCDIVKNIPNVTMCRQLLNIVCNILRDIFLLRVIFCTRRDMWFPETTHLHSY